MIKKIGYSLLFLITILLLFGYFRYNPTLQYRDEIPASAETIIQVNLRALEYGFVSDFCKNPLTYLNRKSSDSNKKSNDSLKSFYKSVYIPINTFLYTNKAILKNCLVSSAVKIKDKTDLETFFLQQNFKEISFDTIKVYQKKHLSFAIHRDKLVFILKRDSLNLNDVIAHVFNTEEYVGEDHQMLKGLKKSESMITLITNENDFIEVDIDGNELFINGVLNDGFNVFLPNEQSEISKEKSILKTAGKLNPDFFNRQITENQKKQFKKLTTLSLDSVFDKCKGDFSFALNSFKKETDTVITYEYDDDFNKIEKRDIKKTTTPIAMLKVKNTNLEDYLENKQVIAPLENEKVLAIIPFFKTFVSSNKDELVFSTTNNQKEFIDNRDKFIFSFNVREYKQQSEGVYKINHKFFKLLKKIELNLSSQNNIKGSVVLEEESYFLTQLFN